MSDLPVRRPARWLSRFDHELPVEQARSRISAYVYGNVLVLAAVAESGPASIAHGTAIVVVAVTTGTTYLAHVLSYAIAHQLGGTPEQQEARLREELVDAVPILVSGGPVLLLLGAGAVGVLGATFAGTLAAAFVVARLAITGWAVERLNGHVRSSRSVWSGVGLAAAGGVIAAIKVAAGH